MSRTQEWSIHAPEGYAYTPAEMAQIAVAVQAFESEISKIGAPKAIHVVRILDIICMLGSEVKITWPQPVRIESSAVDEE